MKNHITTILILLWLDYTQAVAAGGPSAMQWGPTTNGLQMSISLQEERPVANGPIRLSIRFRNTATNTTFQMFIHNAREHTDGLSFVVRSPSGGEKRLETQPIGGSASIITIGPGESRDITVDISRLGQFAEMGRYEVTAQYRMSWSAQAPFIVASNPLIIQTSSNP